MDELIARFLKGDATAAEKGALRDWRAASLLNERRFRELARVWADAGVLAAIVASEPPSAGTLIQRMKKPRWRIARRKWIWLAAAAALGGLLLGPRIWDATFGRSKSTPSTLHASQFVTGPGETSTVQLPDGSIVRLGPESRLMLTADNPRDVSITGTAFFAVAKDESQNFVVRTEGGVARVLGTRFEVRARAGEFRVVVLEGTVAVGEGSDRVEVRAGEMSHILPHTKPSVIEVANPRRLMEWLGRVLVFQDTPLRQVTAEIEEQYDVRVTIADSVLTERVVTAWFNEHPVDQVVAVVCRAVNARCTIDRSGAITIHQ